MARGLNKVMIMGHLGADPEVRYMPSGSAVATLRVATSEYWKDKQSGEKQERTEWHRIVLFNKLGEIAAQYLKKGSRVFVEGSLRTNKWQDQSGADRYTTEIIGSSMELMDSKGGAPAMDQSDAPPARASNASGSSKAQAPIPAMDESFDDDIPF